MVENIPLNLMLCDASFTITYINPAARRTLKAMEPYLKFSTDNVVGQSIDIFASRPWADSTDRLRSQEPPSHREDQARAGDAGAERLVNRGRERPARGRAHGLAVRHRSGQRPGETARTDRDPPRHPQQGERAVPADRQLGPGADGGQPADGLERRRDAAQANVVSAAAEQVSNNVQTVATGAEEMGASIKEIAKNAAEAAKVATVGGEGRREDQHHRRPSSAKSAPRSARSSRSSPPSPSRPTCWP